LSAVAFDNAEWATFPNLLLALEIKERGEEEIMGFELSTATKFTKSPAHVLPAPTT
jgi:hypothetical protein